MGTVRFNTKFAKSAKIAKGPAPIIDTLRSRQQIIRLAIKVHRALGPGLLESAYKECSCWELGQAGFRYERQEPRFFRLPQNFSLAFIG